MDNKSSAHLFSRYTLSEIYLDLLEIKCQLIRIRTASEMYVQMLLLQTLANHQGVGSLKSSWYNSTDRQFKHQQANIELAVEYRKKNLILPLTLADKIQFLYSRKKWHRKFMIYMWELLKIYIRVDRKLSLLDFIKWRQGHGVKDTYPEEWTSQGGPVTIRKSGVEIVPEEYYWGRDEYIYSALALRAVSQSPF
jgi:hypothetical protein